MELMTESISKNTLAENEGRLKEMSDSITALNERLEKKKEADLSDGAVESRLSAITEALALEPNQMGTYDDNLVRQLIETIKVIDSEKLLITFKGGMQFEQAIAPNIRKIRHCR
jgi:hypothetical protein